MPYKLNKIIYQRDYEWGYDTWIYNLKTEIDFPYVAGMLRELVPLDESTIKKYKHELSDVSLFNDTGLTKLIPDIGPKGLYYLELRSGHKLKQLIVEPDEVTVDIYIGSEDTLIYSFYNSSRRNSISVTASIERDPKIYSKIKSDLADIHWRQYIIRVAMNKVQEKESEMKGSSNMTAKEVADYLGVKAKTIRNWTSESKIPSIKIGSAVRYPKDRIDNWLKSNEKKSTRKRATK